MTITPTPAKQPTPEAQIEQLLLGTKEQYHDAAQPSPAQGVTIFCRKRGDSIDPQTRTTVREMAIAWKQRGHAVTPDPEQPSPARSDKDAERAKFEAWLDQSDASGMSESLWQAWQAARAAQESAPSSEGIATWQERKEADGNIMNSLHYAVAEISDLRAALARRATSERSEEKPAGATAAPTCQYVKSGDRMEEWEECTKCGDKRYSPNGATKCERAVEHIAKHCATAGNAAPVSAVAGEVHNIKAVQAFKVAFHAANANGDSYDVAVQAGLDAAGNAAPTEAATENLALVVARLEQIRDSSAEADTREMAMQALVCAQAVAGTTAAPSGDALYAAWHKVGADVAGLNFADFMAALDSGRATAGNAALTDELLLLQNAARAWNNENEPALDAAMEEIESFLIQRRSAIATPAATAAPGDLTDVQIVRAFWNQSAREWSPSDEELSNLKTTFGYFFSYGQLIDTVRSILASNAGAAQPSLMRQAVASVVSQGNGEFRVGWLRPERVQVGSLLYCIDRAAPSSPVGAKEGDK